MTGGKGERESERVESFYCFGGYLMLKEAVCARNGHFSVKMSTQCGLVYCTSTDNKALTHLNSENSEMCGGGRR